MTISRRALLVAGAAAAVAAACSKATRASRTTTTGPAASAGPTDTTPAPTGGPATYVAHGPATSTGVALTFHGNDDVGLFDALLARAAAQRAPITVFAVGTWLEKNPDLGRRILDAGHGLANHTWSHVNIAHLSRTAMAAEITRCRDKIAEQTGVGPTYFRPSQIDVPTTALLEQAGAAGYATSVGYDIDPLDYTDPGSALVLSRVKAKLHPGAIVSLHTGHQGTVDAFDGIVEAIRARGLQPMLVKDVLGTA